VLRINPRDNIKFLSENYINTLSTLSQAKQKRFLFGEYGSDEGSLWKRKMIQYKPIDTEKLVRVVIGVDPTGTKEGDEIGIIIVGTDGKTAYILDDYSLHASPKEWGDEAIKGYEAFKGDCIVAEKNYGGEMVEATITDMGRKLVKVKLITSSKGKMLRAEPISAMYERGQVFHTKPFPALEDEMCNYKGVGNEASPNRLDALVFALTELFGGKGSLLDVL
jgi:phage terminase large subunit-like protein